MRRAAPVAVPNLIGLSTAAARNTIKLAGLKVGAVSPLIQPGCARFDQVISKTRHLAQLPAAASVLQRPPAAVQPSDAKAS